jgi:hypothetical protein
MSILTNAWKLLLTLMISVQHDSRDENTLVSDLLQQALGFQSNRGKFSFLKKPDVLVCQTRQSGFWPMHSAIVYSGEQSSAKSDDLVSKTGGFGFPGSRMKQAK